MAVPNTSTLKKNSLDVLDLHFLVKHTFFSTYVLGTALQSLLKIKVVEFYVDVLLRNLPNARVHILDPVNPQPSRATPL